MSRSLPTPIEIPAARISDASSEVSLSGFPLDQLTAGEVKLPLVSLIVINHNFKDFVGKAIESIRSQDYPRLEVVVIDNASTDGSAEIIAAQIGGDPRFKFIREDQNGFVMAAALRGLDLSTGQLVCFVDADDYLFSNFVSTHVQVHLALPLAVAFTSSNVLEVDADGTMLAGGRKNVPLPANPGKRGLRPPGIVPRLATISDQEFERLDREVATLSQARKGWLWSTGTAFLYRRSVIELVRPAASDPEISILSADGYFARFAHWLAGSAVIERPLSAYRIHGENVFGKAPAMMGLSGGTGKAQAWLPRRRRFLLRQVLERAPDIAERTAPGRFWGILDQALDALRGSIDEELGNETVQAIFVENVPLLAERFGLRSVIIELRRRIPRRHLRKITAAALPGSADIVRPLLAEAETRYWFKRLTLRRP